MFDSPGQFDEDIRRHEFSGFGGTMGAEIQWLTNFGNIFARTRGTLLHGGMQIFNDDDAGGGVRAPLENRGVSGATQSILELAIGTEIEHELNNGNVLTARVAWERQVWFDYSHSLVSDLDFPFIFEQFGAPSNVGFGGFVFSAGLKF